MENRESTSQYISSLQGEHYCGDPDIKSKLGQHKFEDVIAQHKFRASSAKWSHLADKVNADFFRVNKIGRTKNVMRQLEREDGSLTSDDVEMRRIASDFYKSLLTRQSFTHEQLALRSTLWCNTFAFRSGRIAHSTFRFPL